MSKDEEEERLKLNVNKSNIYCLAALHKLITFSSRAATAKRIVR